MASLLNLTCYVIGCVEKYLTRKRNSVMVIVTSLWLQRSGVRISAGVIDVLSSPKRLDCQCEPLTIPFSGDWHSFPAKKRPECEVHFVTWTGTTFPNNKDQVFRKISAAHLAGSVTYFL